MMVRGGNSSRSGSNFMQIRYWGLDFHFKQCLYLSEGSIGQGATKPLEVDNPRSLKAALLIPFQYILP